VVLDFSEGTATVLGRGGMCWISGGRTLRFEGGASETLASFGMTRLPASLDGIPAAVWEATLEAERASAVPVIHEPTTAIQSLVAQRRQARERGDWSAADRLREQISSAGWEVRDTASGPLLIPLARGYSSGSFARSANPPPD
jgi:hypothetical protein